MFELTLLHVTMFKSEVLNLGSFGLIGHTSLQGFSESIYVPTRCFLFFPSFVNVMFLSVLNLLAKLKRPAFMQGFTEPIYVPTRCFLVFPNFVNLMFLSVSEPVCEAEDISIHLEMNLNSSFRNARSMKRVSSFCMAYES